MNRRQKNKQKFQTNSSEEQTKIYKGANEHSEIRIIANEKSASVIIISSSEIKMFIVNRQA